MNRREMLRRATFLAIGCAGNIPTLLSQGVVSAVRSTQSEALPSNQSLRAKGPLKIHPNNPRYFTDGSGRAILLVGSHTWATLQDIGVAPVRPFDWKGFLDLLQSHHHNFMRNWTWEQTAWAPWTSDKILFTPTIYQRTGPGTGLDNEPKFDLTKFNPEFFDRLRRRVIDAGERGVYVSVMLFQGFSFLKPFLHCDPWPGHPYNERNNINGFNGDLNRDSVIDLDRPEVRELQVAYIRKVVDTVNDLDNVLYEVINEGGNREWDWWVVDTVKKYQSRKPKQHPIGVTGAGSETLADMLASPADWISPDFRISNIKTDPLAWEGRKVSILDTDHIWGHGGTSAWVWKSFLRGHNPILMDSWEPIPGTPCGAVNWAAQAGYPTRDLNRRDDPTWEPVRKAMGHALSYATRMNLAASLPHGELASTGYCLGNPGEEYLVYLPEGDEVMVDLTQANRELESEWMHPVEGTITPGGKVKGGAKKKFTVPFLGPAVLYCKAIE
jgi:Family of unknown function (DUF6298)/Putative collagen-binding domain of a collagenase